MIYKNSNAPVLLKKINLNVWSLRDEIGQVIMSKIESMEEKELVKSLIQDYSPEKPALKLIKNEDSQDTESTGDSEETNSQIPAEEVEEKNETNNEEITQKVFKLSPDKISKASTIMSEIYMDEIYFFSESPFLEGQSIVVQFCVPQSFILNADVFFCQTYSASNRVIGKSKLPYRICAKFSFLKSGERTLLRQFLSSIEPELKDLKKESGKISTDDQITEEMFEQSDDEA